MKRTVLIVDDDEMLRGALAKGLRTDNFHVITASSAENANEVLARISVDAIILDRMMTGMDGLTFLKNLRNSGNKTPVLMLTAMSGSDNTIDGLSCGANDYLAKPFQIRELVLRLNNIIPADTSKGLLTPNGLLFMNNEFFVTTSNTPVPLALSCEEKKLLQNLISPIGNVVPASPMVAKRLRNKINIVLSNIDIITVRGQGYKLIDLNTSSDNNNGEK